MRSFFIYGFFGLLFALSARSAEAQSATNMVAFKGLSPVSVLTKSEEGRAALGANYTVTGGVQTGAIRQPTLLPFPEQRQQALKDAFITDGNLAGLADGLGTTLGAAYVARAHYVDRVQFTSISQAIADLIAYTVYTTGADAISAKYFFANATVDGKTPVSADAAAIVTSIGGATDPFGASYGRPAGSPDADAFGDSRPFQTEPTVSPIVGADYFNVPASNRVYNRGPIMNLIDSPSFPSGHTTYGYTGAVLLAIMLPERYQQMIARGAEYGNDRILIGAHYTMDVLGGRTLALYDVAHLLANDPAYLNRKLGKAPLIGDYQAALKIAQSELRDALAQGCGDAVPSCARQDIGRFSNPASNEAFYAVTQTYGLPAVYGKNANALEDVSALAHEAGYLLTAAFPSLSLDQADQILTETEGPGGGFLDDGSSFGVYSRLNLYAAAGRAAALAAGK
jgi:membrane-associated phospholipid phosphatase